MQNDKYWRSKVPVHLALLFVVNVFLVMALEILLFYRYPADLTEADFAGLDSAYQNCAIVASDDVSTFRCWLIKTEAGDYAVVPAQQHGILTGKAKILKSQIQILPADTEETVLSIRRGVHTTSVIARLKPLPGLNIDYFGFGSGKGAATLYMVIAAILEFLELAVWELIKHD